MNKKTRLFLCLSLVVCSLLFTVKVDAATETGTYKRGPENIKTSEYGLAGDTYTNYNKTITSSKGTAKAYCPELLSQGPPNNVTVSTFGSKYNRDNYVAGQIIRMGRDKYSGKKEYMYITQALNCYYGRPTAKEKYPKANLAGCNSEINNIVNKAVNYVNKYYFTEGSAKSSLPPVNIKASPSLTKTATSTSKNATYVSGPITVSGLTNEAYGSKGTKNTSSTVPTYKVALSNSVSGSGIKLCTNEAGTTGCISNGGSITSNGTYYLIVTNAGLNGGKSTMKITGSNTSKYPSAKRWWYNKSKKYQRFVTYTDNVQVKRSVPATGIFTYAAADKYSVAITKIDDTGEVLPGASLELFTAADKDGKEDKVTLCTTSASDSKASCTVTGIASNNEYKYYTNRYICWSETTTPKGYTNITPHCDLISLGSKKYYYKMETSGDNETLSNETDYHKAMSYEQGTDLTYQYHIGQGTSADDYIYRQASTIYKYAYSDNRPAEYKDSDEDYKHIEVDDTTGATNTVWYIEEGGNRVDINVTPINNGTQGCYNQTAGFVDNPDFCSGDYQFTEIEFSSGNAIINVGNALNYVSISKKAITGDDEVPGATLSVFKADNNGNCSKDLAKSKRFIYSPYTEPASDGSTDDDSSTDGDDSSTDGDDIATDGEGEDTDESDEVPDIATSGLRWVSSTTPAIIYGLDPGNYCLQEEIPPVGYKTSPTVVKFNIDESGKVTTTSKDNYDEETNTLIIRDEYTKISISKTDIATTKELPGAQLKICSAVENDKGEYEPVLTETGEEKECRPDLLADGTEAAWTSGTTPHDVVGLAAGTYYLIETTAPNGYSVAESVLFVLKEDGTLTDINGKSLADNKLVMYDAHIKVPNTAANISFYIVLIALFLFLLAAYGTYCVYKDKEMFPFIKKIKKKSNKK